MDYPYQYPQPGVNVGPYVGHGAPAGPGPYGVPASPYGVPASPYGVPANLYGVPASPYGAAPMGYGVPAPGWNPNAAAAYPGYFPPPPYTAASSSVPAGKSYFLIRSRVNGLVLDVKGANPAPNVPVILWAQKSDVEAANQMWFEDAATGTIRSKLNEYCFDIDGNRLVLRPHKPGNVNQLWEISSNNIRNRCQPHKVISLDVLNCGSGANVLIGDLHQKKKNAANVNCFDFQSVSSPDLSSFSSAGQLPPRRKFYIVSDLNRKVLDINGADTRLGSNVIMWPRKPYGQNHNQLWYFDAQGFIRSALNDMALDTGASGGMARMMPFNGDVRQQWHLLGNRIVNNANECLDIRGESKKDGAEVISYGYKGSANQHWRIEFE